VALVVRLPEVLRGATKVSLRLLLRHGSSTPAVAHRSLARAPLQTDGMPHARAGRAEEATGCLARTFQRRHTRRRGRIYRYYVTREAIADGYDSCPITSVPAADVEGPVLDHVQKLLAAPELVARTWAVAKREGDQITEREVTALLADFATICNELFPAEQARIVQLLVERVDVQEDALEVRIRAEGLASLVGELRQQRERMAA
jgi:hypothetical protein